MNWRYKLLQIDSFSGLIVGAAELLLSSWLHVWYRLPLSFIYVMVTANFIYGCYSFSLYRRKRRPLSLIVLLIVANLSWGLLCVIWTLIFASTASPFGLVHLLLTALYVTVLAYLEWRNRNLLLVKPLL